MWELVRANKRRSILLMLGMLCILLVLGFFIGAALIPSFGASSFEEDNFSPGFAFDPTGGILGVLAAFFLWGGQAGVAYFRGDKILLSISGAKPLAHSDHPQLFNVVEEMTIAASLPKMPTIYIIDDMGLNAFATGREAENASVAVTAGLLGRLNRDQLQGVVAHEIAHIVNRDVMLMTVAGIMVGTVLMISDVFLHGMRGGARYRGGRKNDGQAILLVIALVVAIVAPFLAQILYFAISRRREYLADAGAAIYTRYPQGLASALEILASDNLPLERANRATAPMYIVNPLRQDGMMLGLSRTHPPIEDRIRVLRTLSGEVSYAAYQQAMRKSNAHHAAAIPASGLSQPAVPVREAHPDTIEPPKTPAQRMREAGDLLRNLNHFLFLPCTCGMSIKLPPDFKKEHVHCPRCKRELRIPAGTAIAAGTLGEQLRQAADAIPVARAKGSPPPLPDQAQPPLKFERQGKGWSSVQCSCGNFMNIGPSFQLDRTSCRHCGRIIELV